MVTRWAARPSECVGFNITTIATPLNSCSSSDDWPDLEKLITDQKKLCHPAGLKNKGGLLCDGTRLMCLPDESQPLKARILIAEAEVTRRSLSLIVCTELPINYALGTI